MISFVIHLPGFIVTAITGIVVFVQSLANNVYGCISSLVSLFDSAEEAVQSLVATVSAQEYWGFFYNLFAIDVFGSVLTTFLGLAVAALVLIVFDFLFQGIVVAVPFLIYKSIGKLLQAVSAGFAKPA